MCLNPQKTTKCNILQLTSPCPVLFLRLFMLVILFVPVLRWQCLYIPYCIRETETRLQNPHPSLILQNIRGEGGRLFFSPQNTVAGLVIDKSHRAQEVTNLQGSLAGSFFFFPFRTDITLFQWYNRRKHHVLLFCFFGFIYTSI